VKDQGTAQLFEAAGTGGTDASERDSQPQADFPNTTISGRPVATGGVPGVRAEFTDHGAQCVPPLRPMEVLAWVNVVDLMQT